MIIFDKPSRFDPNNTLSPELMVEFDYFHHGQWYTFTYLGRKRRRPSRSRDSIHFRRFNEMDGWNGAIVTPSQKGEHCPVTEEGMYVRALLKCTRIIHEEAMEWLVCFWSRSRNSRMTLRSLSQLPSWK